MFRLLGFTTHRRSGSGYFMTRARLTVPVLVAGLAMLPAAPAPAQAANTVALSGVISAGGGPVARVAGLAKGQLGGPAGGVPVAAVTLNANGQVGGQSFGPSTTSAADGSFTLNVPPGSTVNFNGG